MEQRTDRALLLSLVVLVALIGVLLYLIWVIADPTPLPLLVIPHSPLVSPAQQRFVFDLGSEALLFLS